MSHANEPRGAYKLFIPVGPDREVEVTLKTVELSVMGASATLEEFEPTMTEAVAAFKTLMAADLSRFTQSSFSLFLGPGGPSPACANRF